MPTFNSEYYANQIGGQARYRAASNVANGDLREATLEYKFVGTEASADIIKFGRLDPGVTVQSDSMKLLSEGIGGTTVTTRSMVPGGSPGCAATHVSRAWSKPAACNSFRAAPKL